MGTQATQQLPVGDKPPDELMTGVEVEMAIQFRDIAVTMLMRGIPVIPIPPGEKGTRLMNWPNLATTDMDQVEKWNLENPRFNCGAVAKPEGIWILDCDDPHLPQRIEEETGNELPVTFTVKASKAPHFYFKQTDASRQMGNVAVGGLFDAQVNNKYVVAPGSLHPSGIRYQVINDGEIVSAPDWLVAWVAQNKRIQRRVADPIGYENVTEGGRDNFLFKQACRLRDAGVSRPDALNILLALNMNICLPPMTDLEVRRKIESAFRREPSLPQLNSTQAPSFPLTDCGNAELFVRAHGKAIRYCHASKKWFTWDGIRWVLDDTGKIYRLAKETVKSMLLEARNVSDDKQRQALILHEQRCESEQRLKAMVSLAQHESGIPVRLADLDSDPMLINVINGTLDLRTDELRSHSPQNLMTKLAPVEYDPTAQCPAWMKFLDDVTAGRNEVAQYLQRCVGYSLTGATNEHALFLLYGTGANGKSTFLEALRYVLGDYVQAADFQSFMVCKGQPIRNDIARLRGARFVTATESEAGKRIAESLIKQITGGDSIQARFLHSEHFEFKPQFKLWLATNHKPTIHGTDEAIWRRIRLVPFTVSIAKERQDRDLLEKLRAEASGIFRWAVEGLQEYRLRGLSEPAPVNDATSDYRRDEDALAHFIDERCVISQDGVVKAHDLYMEYKSWAIETGEWVLNERQFSRAMDERGFAKQRKSTGIIWRGIAILTGDRSGALCLPMQECRQV